MPGYANIVLSAEAAPYVFCYKVLGGPPIKTQQAAVAVSIDQAWLRLKQVPSVRDKIAIASEVWLEVDTALLAKMKQIKKQQEAKEERMRTVPEDAWWTR